MRIVHINTNDSKGGAARATLRLHQGLQALGQQSQLLVRHKMLLGDRHIQAIMPPPSIKGLPSAPILVDDALHLNIDADVIQEHYINNNRTPLSNILFSFPYPGLDLTSLPLVQAADIIHLHWIAGFQSPITLHALLQLGKPVIWTLHDMWPFTGGCHSSAGCANYQLGCQSCPQLHHDPYQLPAAVLQDKQDLLVKPNLTIVAPSQQIANFARHSQIFKNTRVEVIHNSIDTNQFYFLPKAIAKQELGLSTSARVIAFGAEDSRQRSKGISELITVIRLCQENPDFQTALQEERLYFICCGNSNPDILALNIPLLELGLIRSDETLRTFYAAADVFIQPSLEESFGNMAVEALCCGTPVIGFDVGVAPEAIIPDKMGQTVPVGDTPAMAEAVIDFFVNPDKWTGMSEFCHQKATAMFHQEKQANSYFDLYQNLLDSTQVIEVQPNNLLIDKKQGIEENFSSINVSHKIYLPWTKTLGTAVATIISEIGLFSLAKEVQAFQLGSLTQDYQELKEILEHREERLSILRDRIQQFKERLQAKEDELEQLQRELTERDSEITAMKSSKFWQLRTFWLKIRSRLGNAEL